VGQRCPAGTGCARMRGPLPRRTSTGIRSITGYPVCASCNRVAGCARTPAVRHPKRRRMPFGRRRASALLRSSGSSESARVASPRSSQRPGRTVAGRTRIGVICRGPRPSIALLISHSCPARSANPLPGTEPVRGPSRGLARRDRSTGPLSHLGVLVSLVVGVPASGSCLCTAPNAGVLVVSGLRRR
jgi:hypothetical protein